MNLFEGIDMFKLKCLILFLTKLELKSNLCMKQNAVVSEILSKNFFDPNPSGGERRGDGFFNPKIHREISDGKT